MFKSVKSIFNYSGIILLKLQSLIYLPQYVFYKLSGKKSVIDTDILRYKKEYGLNYNGFFLFLIIFVKIKHFRSQFYYRIEPYDRILSILYRRYDLLKISCPEICDSLLFHHPYATIINAKYIGSNCTIRHLTTIGNKNEDNNLRPTILNNVNIGSGATIIGNVLIGNNVSIGSGSVIVKNVPDNCTVVGNPAYIIEKDGIRQKIKL